jgi:RNA polymerase sigma-70 factor (ECF subfamily)
MSAGPPSDSPQASLVARLRSGDREAFEEVFRAHYGKLADYARGLVGSGDSAEDVVQEVFVTLWTQRDRISSPDNLVAYLYRSVRNRGLNFLRHERLVADFRSRRSADDPAEFPPADREAESAEIARAVRRAVAALPPRSREVFQLSRDQGLTYPEIAATLGISIKTVETLMGRALKAVRERLAAFRA